MELTEKRGPSSYRIDDILRKAPPSVVSVSAPPTAAPAPPPQLQLPQVAGPVQQHLVSAVTRSCN